MKNLSQHINESFKNKTPEKIMKVYPGHKKQVGKTFQSSAGAPGIGYIEYMVTKIDNEWIWGYVVADTMYVPGPEFYR